MKNQCSWNIACAVAAVLAGSSAFAAEPPAAPTIVAPPALQEKPHQPAKPVAHSVVRMPAAELATTAAVSNAGFGAKSAFTASAIPSPDSSNLSPPVTITYSGGSPVLQINDSGTNKGVLSQITNTHNSTSALYGQTNGGGAGLTGYNSGTAGPGGKFGILNSSSAQPGVFTTTNGTGPALLGTITTASSGEPALLGQNQVTTGYGIGVEGQGNEAGVQGVGGSYGVYGIGSSVGAWGYSSAGDGVFGESYSGDGVYAYSYSGDALYAYSVTNYGVYAYSASNYAVFARASSAAGALYAYDSSSGNGISAYSASGIAVYASSATGYAIRGQSANTFGVIGEDSGSGVGVYGYSASGLAGWFNGKVQAVSYVTSSDRNSKTKIHAVDGKEILDKVNRMPVSSWVFKDDPQKNHVGPMAQDFHAAFGLDGTDDKHINLTDIAGVSLASIQELGKEMKQKDAEIADLRQQLSAQMQAMARMQSTTDTVVARMTALEQQQQRLGVSSQTVSLRKESGTRGE